LGHLQPAPRSPHDGTKTIDFAARRVDDLPALAWIAVLPRHTSTLALLHGPLVEVFRGAFFEGAWDGTFSNGQFDTALNVFGSGGRVSGDRITFVAPSHTLEPLYFISTDHLIAASNSLPFVLAHTGLAFDAYDFRYGAAFSAIVNGLDHTPQDIRLQGGILRIVYHHNTILTLDGMLTTIPKELPPNFGSYADYLSYLKMVAARVFENAADPQRCSKYLPLSTISSGYDSAAVAAIAKACGCEETIGLGNSNTGEIDSGRRVAEALGMLHTEFERMKKASGGEDLQAEFLSSGMQGEDLVYSVFEQKLKGRVLTTGFQGGKVWERSDPPDGRMRRGDLSGSSLAEFRIRTNFLHLPMAFIGCQRHADILRISNAPEMANYSVGGTYDRPVPRRILEEAGVSRSLFAQAKRGASIILFQSHQSRMSRAAHRSIASYCKRQDLQPWYTIVLGLKLAWWTIGRNLYRLCRRLRKVLRIDKKSRLARLASRMSVGLFGIEAPVYGASHPRFTILLMWAAAEVGRRYLPAGRYKLAGPAENGLGSD
jgi:hypothetical protein